MTGQKKNDPITLHDVAEAAGVSIATVSRVINGKRVSLQKQQRVLGAIKRLDYRPNVVARSLKIRQSQCVGLIIPDIENPFFPALVRGVEDVCREAGYAVFLCNTDGLLADEARYLDFMASRQVDGLLFAAGQYQSDAMDLLQQIGLPLVLIDRQVSATLPLPRVGTDNFSGAYEAVKHLFAVGCQKVGMIGGPDHLSTSCEREAGFRSACCEQGRENSAELITKGDFSFESGYEGAKSLLAQQVDGIFAANDMMAIGCLEYAAAQGISVPHELAIIGFDDIRLAAWVKPSLSTIRQPVYEIGRMACENLLALLRGEKIEPVHLFVPELIARQSTRRGE